MKIQHDIVINKIPIRGLINRLEELAMIYGDKTTVDIEWDQDEPGLIWTYIVLETPNE